jgi:tRNA(Ile)-lysidine synthase TilS/MesJ
MERSLKVCRNCVLPETFPGIRFNEEGLCNFCLEFKSIENKERMQAKYKQKFEKLIKEYKNKSTYDAIMCYSGGKDSTFTMAILREEYGFNILALIVDNGFLSDQVYENIYVVTEKLGIDSIIFKPRFDVLSRIFRYCATENPFPIKTIERASTICTSCMAIVKAIVLRFAVEKDIPFITFGWSPGQASISSSIMKNNPQMVKLMQKTCIGPLHQVVGDNIKPYFLEDKHYSGSYNFPYNIHPLAFWGYNEEKIYQKITQLGWKAPQDVDANSTNCRLNSLANVVHKKRYGFHPYSFELANLVREGYLDRAVALDRINQKENQNIVKTVMDKLAITEDSLEG